MKQKQNIVRFKNITGREYSLIDLMAKLSFSWFLLNFFYLLRLSHEPDNKTLGS